MDPVVKTESCRVFAAHLTSLAAERRYTGFAFALAIGVDPASAGQEPLLPAVVPDVAGCRDIVLNGETGFICKSVDEFALRLRELIESRGLRQNMGRAAKNMGKERFSVERMHREMIMVYGLR